MLDRNSIEYQSRSVIVQYALGTRKGIECKLCKKVVLGRKDAVYNASQEYDAYADHLVADHPEEHGNIRRLYEGQRRAPRYD